jgi:hypothetical protein
VTLSKLDFIVVMIGLVLATVLTNIEATGTVEACALASVAVDEWLINGDKEETPTRSVIRVLGVLTLAFALACGVSLLGKVVAAS